MFAFFDQVLAFFNQIIDFITSGIYEFFTDAFAQLIIYLTVSGIKFKIFMLQVSWDTAQDIMSQLNVSETINSAFVSLNSNTLNFLTFYRIPECINIIMSSYITRYVLSFIGL